MELYGDKRPSGTYYRIRESYREGGKVKKRTVQYLGTAEKILKRWEEPTLRGAELSSVPFGAAAALRRAFEDLELDEFFTELLDPEKNHDFPVWKKVFLLVWRRFFRRMSIRKVVEEYRDQVFPFWWKEEVPTVQRLYQFPKESLDEEVLKTAQVELARRVLGESSVETCRFDTTNYCTFVKEDTEYLRVGRSKKKVVGRRLVGLALALSDDGTPMLSHAYPGNKHDSELFTQLFGEMCERIEAVGSDLEDVTIVFDRGFDDKGNFNLAWGSRPYVVAGAKRNRKVIREKIDEANLDEFGEAYETTYGKCYVKEAGHAKIDGYRWRVVLSYHDATREKVQKRMEEMKEETEELLADLEKRAKRKGPGRPLTKDGIEKELRDVLKRKYKCLDCSFDPESRELDWRWNDEWDRQYEVAGIHAVITDRESWAPNEIIETYFSRQDLEKTFHLTKEALIVPVEPPYVKEDHLIRAHLFFVFVGLLCYRYIRGKLPDDMTEEEIKTAMEKLDMIVASEDDSISFKLANIDKGTTPLLRELKLEEYLPE